MVEDREMMELSGVANELSLNDSDEILEGSYVENEMTNIEFGNNRLINLITPKKQTLFKSNIDSPMVIDSTPQKLESRCSNGSVRSTSIDNGSLSITNYKEDKENMSIIEISDDSDCDLKITARSRYNKQRIISSDDDDMDVQSPLRPVNVGLSKSYDQPKKNLYTSLNERAMYNNSNISQINNEIMEIESPLKLNIKNQSSLSTSKILRSPLKEQNWNCNQSNINSSEYSSNINTSSHKKDEKTEQDPKDLPLSFLSSLSDKTFNMKCDPTATFFKRHFKTARITLAHHLYYIFNEHVFGNQLPRSMVMKWSSKLKSSSGITSVKSYIDENGEKKYTAFITLSKVILTIPERLRDTLIHEMCHAAVWIINKVDESHGPRWKSWTAKARRTFPELPPIKTCHAYDIAYKYVYKCTSCGYRISRHRPYDKLLTRCVCGYCGGAFKLQT